MGILKELGASVSLVAAVAMLLGCSGGVDLDERGASNDAGNRQAAPEGRDVLAVSVGGAVRLVGLDGVSRAVLDGEGILAGASGLDFVAAGRLLLVRAYAESTPQSGLRLALVKSDGALQWSTSFPVSFAGGGDDTPLHWGVTVGADGNVVMDDRNEADFHIAAVAGAGQLPSFFPAGASIDGFLPVRSAWSASDPSETTFGWWRVGSSAALSNVTHVPTNTGDWTSLAGKLVRVAPEQGKLLVQSPSATDAIALPASGASVSALAREMLVEDERWLLVTTSTEDRVVRIDLASRAAEALNLVAPAGYRPFANCVESSSIAGGLQLDRDGRLVRLFRNDDRVAAFVTTDGAQWLQVGESFTSVGGLEATLERGTLFLHGHSDAQCYGPGPVWAPGSSADLAGDWDQTVRLGSGVALASKRSGEGAQSFVLNRSGRFGARTSVDPSTGDATVHVVDFETGKDTIVASGPVPAGQAPVQPAFLWQP